LLYEGQTTSSKTTIQEVKVHKDTKANKVVLHPMKVKEEIVDLEVDPTCNEAIFSYIDKVYIEKFSKHIYYRWVVKFLNSPLVQRRKGNYKQWVVKKLCSQRFIPTTCTETKDENLIWSNLEDSIHFI
jgi:hypothetical protein